MTGVSDGPPALPPPPPGPEELLLQRAGQGDRAAFQALYERFARPLMTFLLAHTADHALAEDLLQETFLRVWRAAPRWSPRARASTWLFTIAHRVALSASSRWRRWRRPVPAAQRPSGSAPASPPSDDGATLTRALNLLPEAQRTAVILVRLNGLTLAEAAGIQGVPIGTVKSRLSVAEASLRLHLGGGDDVRT